MFLGRIFFSKFLNESIFSFEEAKYNDENINIYENYANDYTTENRIKKGSV
jgi:hypothetical protein